MYQATRGIANQEEAGILVPPHVDTNWAVQQTERWLVFENGWSSLIGQLVLNEKRLEWRLKYCIRILHI